MPIFTDVTSEGMLEQMFSAVDHTQRAATMYNRCYILYCVTSSSFKQDGQHLAMFPKGGIFLSLQELLASLFFQKKSVQVQIFVT